MLIHENDINTLLHLPLSAVNELLQTFAHSQNPFFELSSPLAMFSKAILIVSAFFAITASATMPASQCNAGGVQCCDNIQKAGAPAAAKALASVGLTAQDGNVPIGLSCNPISGAVSPSRP